MQSLIFFVVFASLVALSIQQTTRNITNTTKVRTPEEKASFKQWRQKYKKRYSSRTEGDAAMEKVLLHKEKIDEHNKLFAQGKVTFQRGLWEHSDMSHEEKQKYLMGLKVPPQTRSLPSEPSIPQFPHGQASVNWTAKGLVAPVEDQGKQCRQVKCARLFTFYFRLLWILLGILSYWNR